MFSFSTVLRAPFRVLTTPTVIRDVAEGHSALALGRNHASWFLVYVTRHFIIPQRAVMSLNFVVPGDPNSVGARSPAGRSMFTVGGFKGNAVMEALSGLRDQHGVSPVALTRKQLTRESNPYHLLADVEVLLPENDLAHACAHCGRWETLHSPRFRQCSGCQSRRYCSEEYQRADWKPEYHEGECTHLKEGRVYEAECRRKLHNNGWWFDYSDEGDFGLFADTGLHTYERALREVDVDEFVYGRRYPPHDVPATPPRRALPAPHDDGYPPGFVPTGCDFTDDILYNEYQARQEGATDADLPAWRYPVPDSIPPNALPKIPPLPETGGFLPTGDTWLDQTILCDYLDRHREGNEARRSVMARAVRARTRVIRARQRLAKVRLERLEEELRNAEELQ